MLDDLLAPVQMDLEFNMNPRIVQVVEHRGQRTPAQHM